MGNYLNSSNLAYDSHGDITTLADETMTYDESGRHLSTTTTGGGGATVSYLRDASDAIVQMTTNSTTDQYGGGGGVEFTFSTTGSGTSISANGIQETDITLAGGVTVSIQSSAQVWAYPDLHGDDVVTADQTGSRSARLYLYDPFGDPIDLSTGLIGSSAANSSSNQPNDTTTAGTDAGWEGSHGKDFENSGDIATIEMGDRQYVPILGRFLSPDPIPGGNSNDYNYPNDPVNASDLSGQMGTAMQLAGDDGGISLPKPLERSILAYIVNQDRGKREYRAAQAHAFKMSVFKGIQKGDQNLANTADVLGQVGDILAVTPLDGATPYFEITAEVITLTALGGDCVTMLQGASGKACQEDVGFGGLVTDIGGRGADEDGFTTLEWDGIKAACSSLIIPDPQLGWPVGTR